MHATMVRKVTGSYKNSTHVRGGAHGGGACAHVRGRCTWGRGLCPRAWEVHMGEGLVTNQSQSHPLSPSEVSPPTRPPGSPDLVKITC